MLAVLANRTADTRALRPSHRPDRAARVRSAVVRPKPRRAALWFEPDDNPDALPTAT